ncbi:Phage head-tail joining protein [Lactococcus lactis subsp. lactis]|nr:Phage head-tail joining protein [Lactococcus lactis subsp. lactis]
MIGDSMKIFKNLFSLIWKIFDVLMFIAFAITITVTMFMWNKTAGGIALSVVFILAGLISEFIEKKGGD